MLKGENYGNQLYESYASRLAINTMLNGECGVIDDYGSEMEPTVSGNTITIADGFAVIKGGLLIETTYETLNVTLQNNMFHVLVLEIDLSQVNTREQFNQGSFKILSQETEYPSLTQEDISLTPTSGIYQMELARFQTTNSAITNFTDKRNIVSYIGMMGRLAEAIREVKESVRGEKLWENPNPHADFLPQTIQLRENDYGYYRVLFHYISNDPYGDSYPTFTQDVFIGDVFTLLHVQSYTPNIENPNVAGYLSVCLRNNCSCDNHSMTIGKAYQYYTNQNTKSVGANQYLIPVAIYGYYL